MHRDTCLGLLSLDDSNSSGSSKYQKLRSITTFHLNRQRMSKKDRDIAKNEIVKNIRIEEKERLRFHSV